jgi:two-component system chemotaxis response regulator CheB
MEALRLVVIGGSWGGIQASLSVLEALPAEYPLPILLVLHRQRNQPSELHQLFDKKLAIRALEAEEKQRLKAGHLYIAPANYHVLLENDLSLALDSSEAENFSRPAIDVTFSSAARVLGEQVLGILLSGASEDGSRGLQEIAEKGGMVIVQDPHEAQAETMPRSAIRLLPDSRIFTLSQIQAFLLSLI